MSRIMNRYTVLLVAGAGKHDHADACAHAVPAIACTS